MGRKLRFLLLLILMFSWPSFSAQKAGGQGIYTGSGQNRKLVKGQLLLNRSHRVFKAARLEDVTVLYHEDFESGLGSWTVEGGVWEVGVPTSGPYEAYSDTSLVATVLDGSYPDSANAILISPEIHVPAGRNVKLSFWHWYSIESGYDFGYLKISLDKENWFTLKRFSGYSGGWIQEEIDLEAYAGQKLYIAFQFSSDGSITYDGWYVDDVMITMEGVPDPLKISLVDFSYALFPQLYAVVTVDSMGLGTRNLDDENFYVYENGVLQTQNFDVVPPYESGGLRAADIVFVLDVSGSMGDEIESVRSNMRSFVNLLAESGIDYRVGFITYADWDYIYNDGNLYSRLSDILDVINNVQLGEHGIGDGADWLENPYYALSHAVRMNFRPGAQKILIMITDAPAHTVDDPGDAGSYATFTDSSIIEFLLDAGCQVFPVFDTGESLEIQQYVPIAKATQKGVYFDIGSSFDSILSYISALISRNYVVTYRSSNPELDGRLRNVMIVVSYWGYCDTVYTSYTPGSFIDVKRTEETAALSDTVWSENTSFKIEAIARKYSPPEVQSVTLFFRNTGDSSFVRVNMEHVVDSLWSYTLPDTVGKAPGIDYYLSATDGINTATDPPIDPAENPFQIAILPNRPPYISHIPPKGYLPGFPVEITATVVDTTQSLKSVELYYKGVEKLVYNRTNMRNISGNIYSAIIPGDQTSENGMEYYIKATDNYGFSSVKRFLINPFPVSRESWFINISVMSGPASDLMNYAGVSPYARDGLDSLDVPEPPGPASGYLLLYFPHSEWVDTLGPNYMVDCRTSRDLTFSTIQWDFEVKTDLVDTDITIKVVPDRNFPEKYLVVLYDLTGNRKQIMNIDSTYTYSPSSSEVRNFRLVVGKIFQLRNVTAGWHLFGVPILPDSTSFCAMNDKSVRSKFYTYQFVPDTGYIVTDRIKPGTGFWLGALSDIDIGAYGVPIVEDTVEINLNRYWNIISNPFMVGIDSTCMLFSVGDSVVGYDSAVALGWISPGLYGFSGTGYFQADSIIPWNGYWLASLRDSLKLKMIPPDTTKPVLPKPSYVTKRSSDGGWFVVMRAETKDKKATDDILAFGLRSDATSGFDLRYDYPKPPVPPSRYIRSYFYHPEWDIPLGPYFAYDIRSLDSTRVSWKFYLESGSSESEEIILKWDSSSIPDNVALTLIDKSSGRSIDMVSTDTYTFTLSSDNLAEFEISTLTSIHSDRSYAVPNNFALHQNYPNPFNPTTVIKFDIPTKVHVSLAIYDLMGHEVKPLIDRYMEPGSYSIKVSCEDLNSGIYFYRIKAGSFVSTKKMVVIK